MTAILDYYTLLGVAPSATPSEIKQAYRRLILMNHPDKQPTTTSRDAQFPVTSEIHRIKEAYDTLRDSILREAYDSCLRSNAMSAPPSRAPSTQRPAQMISLEEFDERKEGEWVYACRCGGVYKIDEGMMEEDRHLVGCEWCSEVVWVGYEVEDGDEE